MDFQIDCGLSLRPRKKKLHGWHEPLWCFSLPRLGCTTVEGNLSDSLELGKDSSFTNLFWWVFWWVYVNFMRLRYKFIAKMPFISWGAASLQIQIFQATICHTISTAKRPDTTIPHESWDKNSEPPMQCRWNSSKMLPLSFGCGFRRWSYRAEENWNWSGQKASKSFVCGIYRMCMNARHVCDISDDFDSSLISLQMPRFDKEKTK